MKFKNLKDLEALEKNDKHLTDVYLGFEKFISERYTEALRKDIELAQGKKDLHEIIVLFALVAWVNASIEEMKRNTL